MTSLTASATTVRTTALAASSRARRGTAVRLVRIMPVAYSEVTMRTPSTAMASCAMTCPARLVAVGLKLAWSAGVRDA